MFFKFSLDKNRNENCDLFSRPVFMSDLRWAYALECLFHFTTLLLKKWRHLVVNIIQLPHLGFIVLLLFGTNTLMSWDFLLCYFTVNFEITYIKLNSFDFNESKIFLGIVTTLTTIEVVIGVFHETLIRQNRQIKNQVVWTQN